ncbi:MAG: NAD(P)-dependent alcohol dehydrogenase [Anaerolineae bacterium]|nr:NAD(P)-dependent alcohol dehydrogenase [Anaerolineae bacterium]
MKAVVYQQYGSPEVLTLSEIEKPSLKNDEILVKVHATSVTTGDVNLRNFVFVPHGFRLITRLVFGINKPKKHVLGIEFAGEVAAVGSEVSKFKVGDAVFGLDGTNWGAYAEYKAVSQNVGVTHKPTNLSYDQAVAIPNGSLTALTFLSKLGKVQPGEKVLIVGASGSVGSAAVQIAKYLGAEVTGVCSARNVDLVKSLGADHVIDYSKEDFTKGRKTYDVIFDTVNKTRFRKCKRILNNGGRFLVGAGGPLAFLQMARTALFGSKKVLAGTSSESQENLAFIKELVEQGHINPVIDRSYPLAKIVEAHSYVDTGHKRGNVVVTIVPA